jgi:hypothetical protein
MCTADDAHVHLMSALAGPLSCLGHGQAHCTISQTGIWYACRRHTGGAGAQQRCRQQRCDPSAHRCRRSTWQTCSSLSPGLTSRCGLLQPVLACCWGNVPVYCSQRMPCTFCLRISHAASNGLTTVLLLHAVGSNRGARQKRVLCACSPAVCTAAAAKASTYCSGSCVIARSRAEYAVGVAAGYTAVMGVCSGTKTALQQLIEQQMEQVDLSVCDVLRSDRLSSAAATTFCFTVLARQVHKRDVLSANGRTTCLPSGQKGPATCKTSQQQAWAMTRSQMPGVAC